MSHKSHIRAPRPSILARRIRPITLLLAVTGFTATTGWAADATWDGPIGAQAWSLDANWNPDLAPGATSGTTNPDTATFNTNAGATSITIDAGRNVKTLNFASGAGGFTIGTTANAGAALNLSSGGNITLQPGVATTITINSPLVLQPASNTTAGAYTLSNSSGTAATTSTTPKLNVAGNISGGATSAAVTLTLAGNVGSRFATAAQAPQLANTISGVISNGGAASLGVTVSGANPAADRYNAWNLTGVNTFTGNLSVGTGVVFFNSIANAGVASALGAGSQISLAGGGAIIVYTGAAASTDRPISVNGSSIHNKGTGTLTLNGAITGQPVFRGTNTITVNGLISGAADTQLSKTDPNTVILANAANSFSGAVNLLSGTISVASLANSGSVSPLGAGSVINVGQPQTGEAIGRLQFTGPSGGATNRTFIVQSGSNNTALAPAGGILENTVAGQTVTYSGAFRSLGTTAPAATNFGALRFEGAGNGVYSGVIGGLSGGGLETTPTNIALTKSGAGTWELSAANIYYGTTAVSAGTLEVSGSINATTKVEVTGGTLLLSGSAGSKINDSATVTLGGGKVEFSSTLAASLDEQVGALTLSASSVIDFGTFAGGNTLRFADSDGAAWTAGQTLSIWNWTAGSDHLFFGSTFGDGVSTGQLAQISFYSGSGTGFAGLGGYGELGEITPIPEPGATGLLTAAALLGLLGFRERRRLLDRKRSHARP